VLFTNLALLAVLIAMGAIFGYGYYIAVVLMVIVPTAAVGVWMFYVQHQFPGVYWAREGRWSFLRAGLEGSSYYQLPAVLNWFTGNIGYHHIHHLGPRIPNYRLPECMRDHPALQIKPLTLKDSMKCLALNLYDEEKGQMVSFAEAKRREVRPASASG
jgi:acyl-lipid omega-6 desaturase (Delta-12 desaturase)